MYGSIVPGLGSFGFDMTGVVSPLTFLITYVSWASGLSNVSKLMGASFYHNS